MNLLKMRKELRGKCRSRWQARPAPEALEARQLMISPGGVIMPPLTLAPPPSAGIQAPWNTPETAVPWSGYDPYFRRVAITGSYYDDQVIVSINPRLQSTVRDDQLQVAMTSRGVTRTWVMDLYPRFGITNIFSIAFSGRGGNDVFENRTSLGSTAHGGEGNDVLRGGMGSDNLAGWLGNDQIFGGSGDDQISGGPGDDRLFGDVGNDRLDGGDGQDGLLGGAGADSLTGGPGADRFLQTVNFPVDYVSHDPPWWKFWELPGVKLADTHADKSREDVVVWFRDGVETTLNANGTPETYRAGSWRDHEILAVDEALGTMARRTNNNVLLRTRGGSELTFLRQGAGPRVGVNTGTTILLADPAFQSGNDWLRQAVYHETGHNWQGESLVWQAFQQQSGWRLRTQVQPPIGFQVSLDGLWLHRIVAPFANYYARTNPFEDFATSWEATFVAYTGRTFLGGGGASAIAGKYALIDYYLQTLTS